MALDLKFLGAAGTVTGSRTLIHIDNDHYLIDCGLFQGPRELRQLNWDPFNFDVKKIKSIFLTHAHIDHSGYLPRLVKQGYRGPIICSPGTKDLCATLLLDSAKLQEEDAKFANETKHSKHDPALPLYNTEDVEQTIQLLKAYDYYQPIPLRPDLDVIFHFAGHIVGSTFIEFNFNKSEKRIVFSGDIGHTRSLILRGPDSLPACDTLILESTYGDRRHPSGHLLDELSAIYNKTMDRQGVLVIPAFAVGRAQEIIYAIKLLEDYGRIPKVPVILDSPLSETATAIHLKHLEDHKINSVDSNNFFPQLFSYIKSPDESMLACMKSGPLVVISAAGMLNGGRILHHLKARLPHPENTVLFVGFQAEGTKGRFLQDQAGKLGKMRIHHREIDIEAEINTMTSLSAHGDYQDLIDWIKKSPAAPQRIILNHGQPEALNSFQNRLKDTFKNEVLIAEKYKTIFI